VSARRAHIRKAPGARSSRGFTLLEVLLAFVIFALGFATVMEVLSGSMRSAMRAREYSEAALSAQSLMDMVGTELPLLEGSQGGTTDQGFEWNLVISPYQFAEEDMRLADVAQMNGTELFRVDLQLAWSSGFRERQVDFTTVRGRLAGTITE
jgi:general secretion pathway protein I